LFDVKQFVRKSCQSIGSNLLVDSTPASGDQITTFTLSLLSLESLKFNYNVSVWHVYNSKTELLKL